MKCITILNRTILAATLISLLSPAAFAAEATPTRDLTWFLQRMRTLEHLPELENSAGHGSGTWNPTDGNGDITWFRGVKDDYTLVLFEADGPGVVTRIGCDPPGNPESRFQVFVDGGEKPVFDEPFKALLDPAKSPLPTPLVFTDTWPGMFFPIPFAKHIRVQVFDPSGEAKKVEKEFDGVKYYGFVVKGWGRFYEWDYTIFDKSVTVKSLSWPLTAAEQKEVAETAEVWKNAITRKSSPADTGLTEIEEVLEIPAKSSLPIVIEKPGTVRQITLFSDQPESLLQVRLQATWDEDAQPSVDAPVGYFFGCGDRGYEGYPYYSLFIGSDAGGSYANFPMPFRKKANFVFRNDSDQQVTLYVRLLVDHATTVPDHHGYFHATWTETELKKDIRTAPYPNIIMAGSGKPGTKPWPSYVYLKRQGIRGKYVGLLFHAGWPYDNWWGEGDALIWTDADTWPPKYHGTGAECYFNSGHCFFTDRALSGVASKVKEKEGRTPNTWFDRPGDVVVYNFHPLGAFQFQNSITMAIEVDCSHWYYKKELTDQVTYGGTAFWYSEKPEPALSSELIWPRKVGPSWDALKNEQAQPREPE